MNRGLEDFAEAVARFEKTPCDEETFRCLARQAVAIYESHPQQGESVARLMTELWFRSSEAWREGDEKAIGELFADLDVPPAHVAGGQRGAVAKWAAVKRLTDEK